MAAKKTDGLVQDRPDATSILFVALYILVTVATLRHSAAGFASLEGGSVVWGYLSALAVDAGMILSAVELQKRRSFWLIVGLLVSMVASTFTQLLYAVSHASVMDVAAGAQWLGVGARQIADVRVIVLPALLPMLSIVYSFASKGANGTSAEVDVAEVERELDDERQKNATLSRELEQMRKAAPLIDALPMQTRARLFTMADGNGVSPKDVAATLDISLSAAQRGVKDAREG